MTTVQQQDPSTEQRQEFLTFNLGNEQYGVDILRVQEIRGWEPLREMPDAPAYYKGVLDFRGQILPVVDLRVRFGLKDVDYKTTTVIIVLANDHDNNMMGVVVDAVSDVLMVKPSDIKAAPDMGSKINTDYVVGMVSRDDGMIMLVDSGRLIDVQELEVADSVC